MEIDKDDALQKIKEAIFARINAAHYYFGDQPKDNWNIYNLPKNCYYYCFPDSLLGGNTLQSSVVVAVDKDSGMIKYFGSSNDEG